MDAQHPTKHNRLQLEKSPYLIQHADNPVDWFPWGPEAFDLASQMDKPVFLSIGYSTCHWCHVMAHESFEDAVIAENINRHFIPVKVDREERPDIDAIYMSAVMAMTGQGGWPLTIFLTPDKKPIFGGTYFPPYAKWGHPGLVDIITSVDNAWKNQREHVLRSSSLVVEMLKEQQHINKTDGNALQEDILDKAYQQFAGSFDPQHGGFGHAPKFPTTQNLSFLMRYYNRTGKREALDIVEKTLVGMAKGGIFDHIGGGFHRYSTDQHWQVPHFEKMLYDQALIARAFLEAYQLTLNALYRDVAQKTLDYVLRDMQSETGGFFSAEDADSFVNDTGETATGKSKIKKEGAYYIWGYNEIEDALSEEQARIVCYIYGLEENGNVCEDPHGEFSGKNILFIKHDVSEAAQAFKKTEEETRNVVETTIETLRLERLKRFRPHLDDKILADWNGLMVGTLAFGARVLEDDKYLVAAKQGADFILRNLMIDGRLLHRYRDGQASIMGTLEDYAFLIQGLLDVYEASFDVEYLEYAYQLSQQMIELFWDEGNGGFYLTASDAEQLILRPKEIYDGAIPSGNSIAGIGLLRLYHITFQHEFLNKAEHLFNAFSPVINRQPSAYAQTLSAFDFLMGPVQELTLTGNVMDALIKECRAVVDKMFMPNKVLVFRPFEGGERIESLCGPLKEIGAKDRKPAIHICSNGACQAPISHVEELTVRLKPQQSRKE